jgi:hypothetical protein
MSPLSESLVIRRNAEGIDYGLGGFDRNQRLIGLNFVADFTRH